MPYYILLIWNFSKSIYVKCQCTLPTIVAEVPYPCCSIVSPDPHHNTVDTWDWDRLPHQQANTVTKVPLPVLVSPPVCDSYQTPALSGDCTPCLGPG